MTLWPIRLRLLLLMPFACRWNAWVRDFTAKLERGTKVAALAPADEAKR